MLFGVAGQKIQLVAGEHQLRLAVGRLAAEQGHRHYAPGDDGVDRDRPLQPGGGAEQEELGPASGFEHAEEILHPPSLEMEDDDLDRVLGGSDVERGQPPLHRGLSAGWRGLDDMHGGQGFVQFTRWFQKNA